MKHAWYREGVVYQIYPRSFQDSNSDGVGDIRGIIGKIPYLKQLGVSIVWLSPVYMSPNDDNGYDISNYRDILPEFGSFQDMKELIDKLHEEGIKIVMDLVVNHTSDEHPWFVKSAQGDPKYRDYYFWKPEKNNWTSFFGGSAWSYNQERKMYYLHLFSRKQPDLNWDNPDVREEVKDICRFWLDNGVDGFRCDVINIIAKRVGLPKGRFNIALVGKEHYLDQPKIHDFLKELHDEVLEKYDCFTVGETVLITPEKALEYIAEDKNELDMVFQFEHMGADNYYVKWFMKRFSPMNLKRPLAKWQNRLQGKGWNTLYLENHDQPRSLSRFGNPGYRNESAKMLATIIYFQQGTPFIYQGQEIGMENAAFEDLEDYRDIETKNIYTTGRKFGFSHKRMMKKIKMMSRDNARTPMQWDQSENAGFSTKEPWLKANPNYREVNVSRQLNDPDSILNYYVKIIELRKQYPIVVYGDYEDLDFTNRKIYAYRRNLGSETLTVICNFSAKTTRYDRLKTLFGSNCLIHNYPDSPDDVIMRPYEARVYYEKK